MISIIKYLKEFLNKFVIIHKRIQVKNEYFQIEELDLNQQIGTRMEISSNLENSIKKGIKIAQNVGQPLGLSGYDNKT